MQLFVEYAVLIEGENKIDHPHNTGWVAAGQLDDHLRAAN